MGSGHRGGTRLNFLYLLVFPPNRCPVKPQLFWHGPLVLPHIFNNNGKDCCKSPARDSWKTQTLALQSSPDLQLSIPAQQGPRPLVLLR